MKYEYTTLETAPQATYLSLKQGDPYREVEEENFNTKVWLFNQNKDWAAPQNLFRNPRTKLVSIAKDDITSEIKVSDKEYKLKFSTQDTTSLKAQILNKGIFEGFKKVVALTGLTGATFVALKIAMIAGATLSLGFPPLGIGVALLTVTVALCLIGYSTNRQYKQVQELQKVALNFTITDTPSEDLLPYVFRKTDDPLQEVYLFPQITKIDNQDYHLMVTKKGKVKLISNPNKTNESGKT
jgi:hypothetical protein